MLDKKKLSKLIDDGLVASTIENGYIYIILPDSENPGKYLSYVLKLEDHVLVEESDPIFAAWLATNPLANKADLVAGKVPSSQLPSFVDDVIDSYIVGSTPLASDWLSDSVGGDPLTPEQGKIYIIITSGDYENQSFRWSGSAYVSISNPIDFVTQEEVETDNPTENTKATTILRVFQGFVYWLANVAFPALNTTSKNIIGAINELFGKFAGLYNDRGAYDASGNVFPSTGGSGTDGAILRANVWTISVAGTLGETPVVKGQEIRALVDNPGQTAGNWFISLTEGNGVTQLKNVSYIPNLDVNKDIIYCSQYIQQYVLDVANTFSNGVNSYLYVPIVTNGANINFPATWKELKNEYINDSKIYGLIEYYDGYTVQYQLYLIGDNDVTINFPIANLVGVFKVTNESSFVSLSETSSELRAINNPSLYFTSQSNGKNVINNFHESNSGAWYYLNSGGTYEYLLPESCTIGVRMAMPGLTGIYPVFGDNSINDFIGRFTGQTILYFQRSAAPPNIYWSTADDLTHTFIFVVTGTTLQIYVDNVLIGSGTVGAGPMQIDRLFRHYVPIKFNSIGLYQAPLSESERTQLHNWLNYDM